MLHPPYEGYGDLALGIPWDTSRSAAKDFPSWTSPVRIRSAAPPSEPAVLLRIAGFRLTGPALDLPPRRRRQPALCDLDEQRLVADSENTSRLGSIPLHP